MSEQTKGGTKYVCKQCGEVFYAYRKGRKFCSAECYQQYRREINPARECPICGKTFQPRVRNKGSVQEYCSVECLGKAQRGENHPNWKGGRTISSHGYVRINLGNGKREFEHRLVAEEILGRPLKQFEQVHHKNGDKQDNRPENLVVLTDLAHKQLHDPSNYVCPKCGYHGLPAIETESGLERPMTLAQYREQKAK